MFLYVIMEPYCSGFSGMYIAEAYYTYISVTTHYIWCEKVVGISHL